MMNKAEEFVYGLCNRSFLSLWSYANPLGKKKKELCDVLVVFDRYIIIFSVKDISLSKGDEEVQVQRWLKNAVDKSVKQIYGAERWLEKAQFVVKKDGAQGLPVPSADIRKVFRISVSLGSQGKAPINSGDYGKGTVHIFDAISFNAILQELNTISDFVTYLDAKEQLHTEETRYFVESGGEEDLLAYYLMNNRQFDISDSLIILADDLWQGYVNSREYASKVEADKQSLVWDNLIETISHDILSDNLEFGSTLTDVEQVVRVMATEHRFSRRILGRYFFEFLQDKYTRSRCVPSATNPSLSYVFLKAYDENRNYISAELFARCFVIRGSVDNCKKVVGLTTHLSNRKPGFALDLLYFDKPEWTSEDSEQIKYLRGVHKYWS